jgi:hypothetical protein
VPTGRAGVPLPPGETTLLAGCPPAVGGALAPSSGAFGVVTLGFCAGMPGRAPGWLRAGRLFGSSGEPDGWEGEGGVIRDIS